MVAPMLDVGELKKRLIDLKADEGWLKMNLSMLQMTIQGTEIQTTALKAVRESSQSQPEQASISPDPAEAKGSVSDTLQSAMWPWALMQKFQPRMQEASEKPTKKPDKKTH